MPLTHEESEQIAISGLQYLAENRKQLDRFMALSGYNLQDFRENAQSIEFLVGVLEFFMGNEQTLLELCSEREINPVDIIGALQNLNDENEHKE